MNADYPYQTSPRCRAKSKRTGKRCQAPAVNGWTVCRFHGARGGAPKGERNGNYRHGHFTAEERRARQAISKLLETSHDTLRKTFC